MEGNSQILSTNSIGCLNGITPCASIPGRKVTRFTCFQDVMLLREVIAENPFSGESKKKWDAISDTLQPYIPSVSSRCCRERTARLLKLYKCQDLDHLRKFGTEEQYAEKEQLLQEIKELEADQMQQQARVQHERYSSNRQMEKDASLSWPGSSNSSYDDLDNPCSRKRHRQKDAVMDYLSQKNSSQLEVKNKEMEIKAKELELEEKRLKIAERKVALEEERLNMEKERWKAEGEAMKQNQKMKMERWQQEQKNLQQMNQMMFQMFELCMNQFKTQK